jgi:hypothetical protein
MPDLWLVHGQSCMPKSIAHKKKAHRGHLIGLKDIPFARTVTMFEGARQELFPLVNKFPALAQMEPTRKATVTHTPC